MILGQSASSTMYCDQRQYVGSCYLHVADSYCALRQLHPQCTVINLIFTNNVCVCCRALRLLRLSLLAGNHSTMKSNRRTLVAGFMNVPLVWLCASVIAWLFTSASCVAVMEKWVWHDALYFVTSTLTTVGYGDVVVKSSMGMCPLVPSIYCPRNLFS